MRIKDNENAVLDAQQHSREEHQPLAKPSPVPNPESRPTPGAGDDALKRTKTSHGRSRRTSDSEDSDR